jgi:two-component system sensor histidine kinase VicK
MKVSNLLKLVGIITLIFLVADQVVSVWEYFTGSAGTPVEIVVESVVTMFELLVFSVLLIVVWKRVLTPLHDFKEKIPKVAAGDHTNLLAVKGNDEFGQFAAVFNEMVLRQAKINTELDLKVKDKTKELTQKVEELQQVHSRLKEEKERAEHLLREFEKFKLAVDSTSDHVIISDREGIVVYANKATEKITGYSVSDIVGSKAGSLWAFPMDKAYYAKLWDTIKSKKQSFVGMIKNRKRSGEVYEALVSISPILDENGEAKFFVGLERDLSKEMAIDRAKTEFVSVASHQLRTPLAAMNWYLEMLRSTNTSKSKLEQEYFSEVENGVKRMIELVNNLLSASRFELGTFTVHLEDLDIGVLLDGVVHELKTHLNRKKIDLIVDLAKVPKMKLDSELTRFIFQNLLSNAVKYTPDGGRIVVNLKHEGDNVVVSINDNGLGIPDSLQQNIFEKFFRADNVRRMDTEGTGLGLYIVKSVVESTGGKVWFESKENVGTTFFVSLPFSGMKDPRSINQ